MKSWGVLIFAGALSVVNADVEFYSYFKQTNARDPPVTSAVQFPIPQAVAAPAMQMPVGFQLQLLPSKLNPPVRSLNSALQQNSIYPSYLRVRDPPLAEASNQTAPETPEDCNCTTKQPATERPAGRSDPEAATEDSASENGASETTTSPIARSPSGRSSLRSSIRCSFPEYRGMVCINDQETPCVNAYSVDPKCLYKQERCLCSEGYVRPHD